MKALLVIDMQAGSFSETPRFDAFGVVARINFLSAHFRDHHAPVIFIQHDGTRENFLLHGSDEWKILPDLVRGPDDLFVEKTANDSFYETGLDRSLRSNGITELYITGCATDFCVNATIHSALVKDYDITIVRDGHTTGDRQDLDLSAERVIAYHNWLWENLTPTRGRIRVLTLKEITDSNP